MRGIVYKISSPSTDNIYIGSTILSIKKRFIWHKGKYNYCSSNEIINYENAVIEPIEEVECQSLFDLRDRERHYIELNRDICVNKLIPNRTYKEYNDDNKEQHKQYRQDNADKIKQFRNEKHTCECGGLYSNGNKSRHINSPKHKSFSIPNI
jgi:hypothetical protein